jgi:hypothetical protein
VIIATKTGETYFKRSFKYFCVSYPVAFFKSLLQKD